MLHAGDGGAHPAASPLHSSAGGAAGGWETQCAQWRSVPGRRTTGPGARMHRMCGTRPDEEQVQPGKGN